MIYGENFLQYLKENLGESINIKSKNIVAPCPWCEYNTKKKHYHLYISTEAPIFHCFHGGCNISGTLPKLMKKLSGKDETDKFIDKDKLAEIKKKTDIRRREVFTPTPISLPALKADQQFHYKALYLKKRLKFSNVNLELIRGLVFDVNSFLEINKVEMTDQLLRLRDYLQSNFIGFMTEYNSTLILRNVDPKATFKHFKIKVGHSPLADYYRLPGSRRDSSHVILGEGVFDIYTEYIFDYLDLKNQTRLYACALKGGYQSLIKAVSFFEQQFRLDISILSDRDIDINEYRTLKKFNGHLINSLTVYYNRTGKDFNVTPVVPEKFVI